jgi:hypothetical protein
LFVDQKSQTQYDNRSPGNPLDQQPVAERRWDLYFSKFRAAVQRRDRKVLKRIVDASVSFSQHEERNVTTRGPGFQSPNDAFRSMNHAMSSELTANDCQRASLKFAQQE